MDCIICKTEIPLHKTKEGIVYWEHGHNAEPYASGRCCDLCHDAWVLPARINKVIEGSK